MGIFRKKKVQFTDRYHPFRGILSTIVGGISLILILCLFIGSGKAKGNAGESYGYLGTLNMILSFAGFIFGIQCYRLEDVYFIYPTIGTALNAIISIFLMVLYFLGMN